MMRRLAWSLFVLTIALVAVPVASAADAPAPANGATNDANEKAIRATAEAFTTAFNQGNAKDVAALWTADGTLAEEDGEIVKGRAAIEARYAEFFKQFPGAKIQIHIKSIAFPTPQVAIEDGVTEVNSAAGIKPSAGRYTAVHALADGKWRMASVRESSVDVPSNFARLQDLEWLVGKWEARSDETTLTSTFRWIANKSFLERTYTAARGGLTVASGLQIIGWDPQSGGIASWSFDSTGGHGVSRWSPAAAGWRIESLGVRADGARTTALDTLIRVPGEDATFGWHSTDRRVGDVRLPDTDEIVFDRVAEPKAASK